MFESACGAGFADVMWDVVESTNYFLKKGCNENSLGVGGWGWGARVWWKGKQ